MLGTLTRFTAVVFATAAAAVMAAAALLAAAPARAATVSMGEQAPPPRGGYQDFLIYRAVPGELNSVLLTVRKTSVDHRLLVSDQTAPLIAGPGCVDPPINELRVM